jgi:spore germination cell wall hydrolase CwlJ-like protein
MARFKYHQFASSKSLGSCLCLPMRNEEEANMANANSVATTRFMATIVGAIVTALTVAIISGVPTTENAAIIALPVASHAATPATVPLKRTELASVAESSLADILEPSSDTPFITAEPLYNDAPSSVPEQVTSKRKAIASENTRTDVRALKSAVAQARGLPNTAMDSEGLCLAEAVYFESRGQPLVGQLAVAQVILHRVADKRFANSVCGVVQERSRGASRACQFSFVCDVNSDVPNNSASWDEAKAVAKVALMGELPDVTGGKALFFHATNAAPAWRHRMEKTATLGSHLFYRPR